MTVILCNIKYYIWFGKYIEQRWKDRPSGYFSQNITRLLAIQLRSYTT